MTAPDYSTLRLVTRRTITVQGHDHKIAMYLPEVTPKGDLDTEERSAVVRDVGAAIRMALDLWTAGLQAGGFQGNPDAPYQALMDQLFPSDGTLWNMNIRFTADLGPWGEYKKWVPPDDDWFKACFKKRFTSFTQQQQHWIRNRVLMLIFAICKESHAICLSTGSWSTMGAARAWEDPTMKHKADHVDQHGNHIRRFTFLDVPSVNAFQRRRLMSIADKIRLERLSDHDAMISMKRKLLDGALHPTGGHAQAFVQTFAHEYSHNYADTCDFYYIIKALGAMKATHGADYDKFRKKNDLPGPEKGLVSRARFRIVPELLIANADNYGFYLANYIESNALMGGFYPML